MEEPSRFHIVLLTLALFGRTSVALGQDIAIDRLPRRPNAVG